MNFRIYTTENCTYCKASKLWIEKHGYSYDEFPIESLHNYEEYKTAPQIFVDIPGEDILHIGGFRELSVCGL